MVLDNATPGTAQHPSPHDFLITNRALEHPIMKGLPSAWLHANDELYSNLRGPAKNVTVLATALAPTSMPNGTGEQEPLIMTIAYGKGRVFHDTLGHVGATQKEPIAGMNSVDYIVLLQRGTEWAATGSVTIRVPKDFPTADKTSIR
jgi:type 1 glutamine amidotransferase